MMPLLDSTPMPGENKEKSSGEKREMNGAETKAENPEYNSGFDTLGEVPYSGDDPYTAETAPNDYKDNSLTEEVAGSSPNAQIINTEREAGTTSTLDNVEEKAETDYIDSGVTQSVDGTAALAAEKEAVSGEKADGKKDDQEGAAVISAAAGAVGTHAKAEKMAKTMGGQNIAELANKVQENEKTTELAESLVEQNATGYKKNIDENLIEQTKEKNAETKALLDKIAEEQERLKSEYSDMSDEDKERTEKLAKTDNITAYEAAKKLQEDNQPEAVSDENDDNFDIAKILANGKYS